ncbi:MAG: DUF1456 family protein [Sulfurimonas sp.]
MILTTNDILYRIKKALRLSDEEILRAYALESYQMTPEHLASLLKRRLDKSFEPCSYEELGVFLDGLVTLKRGPSSKKSEEDNAVELTNNLILKKIRAALNLKEHELQMLFALVDVELSKQQLSSLFRKEGHKNFKACPDELLDAFLEGLDEFCYSGNEIE